MKNKKRKRSTYFRTVMLNLMNHLRKEPFCINFQIINCNHKTKIHKYFWYVGNIEQGEEKCISSVTFFFHKYYSYLLVMSTYYYSQNMKKS